MPKRARQSLEAGSFRRYAGELLMDGMATVGRAGIAGAAGAASAIGANFVNSGASVFSGVTESIQSGMYRAAQAMSDGMSGGAAMDIGESATVPAQFIPGRGAELSYQRMSVLSPIKFKTGETAGPSLTSALGREHMLYRPQAAMHAFAFKMQLTPPSFLSSGDSVPVNRFVVHNVFRHVLTGTNNSTTTSGTALPYGQYSTSWNQTLGPDKSYVRRLGGTLYNASGFGGTAVSVPPTTSGLVESLQSPYRYPVNGEIMYARMNRQITENLGWNANPMKIAAINAGAAGGTLTTGLQVYSNAVANSGLSQTSFPNVLPFSQAEDATTGPSYYYRTQNGRGQVSYMFNNDGTNPVVVDVVITRIKKGCTLTKRDTSTMVSVYKQGYLNYAYANRSQTNLNGQPPIAEDVTTNARGTFLPAKALDSYKLNSPNSAKDASAPFKQVARDQFILSGGSSRNWSMSMQAMDYNAAKYLQSPWVAPTVGTSPPISEVDQDNIAWDDLTYIISIAISGVPAPYVEFNSGTTYPSATAPLAAVIDRRGTDCSVSVTGAYKEMCHPAYLAKSETMPYINGRLDVPHFGSGSGASVPSITTNDIANIGQAVRSAAQTSALIGMGPFNTVGGG